MLFKDEEIDEVTELVMTSSVVDELNEDGKAECWIWVEYVVDAFTDATVTVNIGRSGDDFVANKDVPDTSIVENDAVNLWLSKEETEVNVEDEPTKFDGKKKKNKALGHDTR